jgi:hypothetical protein
MNATMSHQHHQYMWDTLPEHVLIEMFMFLNPFQQPSTTIYSSTRIHDSTEQQHLTQLNHLGLVCKQWRRAANSDDMWEYQTIHLHRKLVRNHLLYLTGTNRRICVT